MEEPRKAWPLTPSSVSMVTRPSWLLPLNFPVCRPYVVTGISSQPNSGRWIQNERERSHCESLSPLGRGQGEGRSSYLLRSHLDRADGLDADFLGEARLVRGELRGGLDRVV